MASLIDKIIYKVVDRKSSDRTHVKDVDLFYKNYFLGYVAFTPAMGDDTLHVFDVASEFAPYFSISNHDLIQLAGIHLMNLGYDVNLTWA